MNCKQIVIKFHGQHSALHLDYYYCVYIINSRSNGYSELNKRPFDFFVFFINISAFCLEDNITLTPAIDIFAFGMCALETAALELTTTGEGGTQVFYKFLWGIYSQPPPPLIIF